METIAYLMSVFSAIVQIRAEEDEEMRLTFYVRQTYEVARRRRASPWKNRGWDYLQAFLLSEHRRFQEDVWDEQVRMLHINEVEDRAEVLPNWDLPAEDNPDLNPDGPPDDPELAFRLWVAAQLNPNGPQCRYVRYMGTCDCPEGQHVY